MTANDLKPRFELLLLAIEATYNLREINADFIKGTCQRIQKRDFSIKTKQAFFSLSRSHFVMMFWFQCYSIMPKHRVYYQTTFK